MGLSIQGWNGARQGEKKTFETSRKFVRLLHPPSWRFVDPLHLSPWTANLIRKHRFLDGSRSAAVSCEGEGPVTMKMNYRLIKSTVLERVQNDAARDSADINNDTVLNILHSSSLSHMMHIENWVHEYRRSQ
ncbi:hypothetical protein NPIL_72341 [Nephila pilipes]|uniref:Uncharacterized protein n=1 Tax=Nephila pilipes TaxID=299642 RepID=A0A8X6THJ2_NEPPI|nr:hypothetical protein NPIL_72341 [Nephila pilipes]